MVLDGLQCICRLLLLDVLTESGRLIIGDQTELVLQQKVFCNFRIPLPCDSEKDEQLQEVVVALPKLRKNFPHVHVDVVVVAMMAMICCLVDCH